MVNRKLIFLVGFLSFVIVALIAVILFVPAPKRERAPVVATADWIKYRNEKYGFEIQHPADWTVKVTDGAEPKINIYKKSETAKPPFIHHNNVTQVSIFPRGIGTEGVEGETITSSIKFAEPINQAIDFVLADGSRWATYATFANRPAAWQPAGFIWAGVYVKDFSNECRLNDQVLPIGQCDLGDRPEGAKIIVKGSIDKEERAIQERMLQTFIFSKIMVRGEIICLPKKGNGPFTEECAIGLKGDDGKHYGLSGLDQEDIVSGKWTTGDRVAVTGELSSAPESQYDIAGIITVRSIQVDVME